jgi:hypothetical protein
MMAFQDEDDLYYDEEVDDGICEVCGLYSCDCGFNYDFDENEYLD